MAKLTMRDVAVLQFRDGELRELWSHAATSAWAIGDREQGAQRYRWTYLPGGDRIAVSGVEVNGSVLNMRTGQARGAAKPLPRETYCYRKVRRVFVPCAE